MAKVGDRGDNVRRSNQNRTSAPQAKTAKPAPKSTAKPSANREQSRTRDTASNERTSSPKRGTAKALDRESSQTESNPSASREVTRRQSSTARNLTDGPYDRGKVSSFDNNADDDDGPKVSPARANAVTPGSAEDNDDVSETEPGAGAQDPSKKKDEAKLDHLVDNPVEEEQRSDLEPPEAFQPGGEPPKIPDFAGQTPTSVEDNALSGRRETFEQDGVSYTKTTRPDGTVSTSYEQDGINYSSSSYEDGRSSLTMSKDSDTGLHSRTVETAADGKVTDTSNSSQGAYDANGKWSYQSRQETVGSDGVRTINEEVKRPDGGTANVTRTVQPDGRVNESYTFKGDQGTVNRTTDKAVDGTAETKTERTYTVDESLEELIDAPAIPEHAEQQIVPLPKGDRSDTNVREVEVVTTDANGKEELQYAEESYSQSSGDVKLNGSQEVGKHDVHRDTFPAGILPNQDGSNITHTVTKVRTRDESGNLVESTGASQTLNLAGDRHPDFGGGKVNVQRTESWNAAGESTSSFQMEGFKESDLFGLSYGSDISTVGLFSATVEGRSMTAGYPSEAGGPFDHYNRKGGGELQDWLSLDGSDPLDVGVTVSRNAKGDEVSNTVTLSALDSKGEGKTATRTDNVGAVGWTYTNFENGGDDYQRQTVFEGTDISIYEEHEVTGPGQFRTTSETREGEEVVATSEATREELSEKDLRQKATDGGLTQAQVDRMLTDGPPYYAENYQEHAEALLDDDGNLRTDENGNPLQSAHDIVSSTYGNEKGYAVSDHYRQDFKQDGSGTDSRLKSVTDPLADPPISGQLTNRERSASGSYTVKEQGDIKVGADGKFTYNGDEVGQFEFGGSDLSTLLREGGSLSTNDLLGVVKMATDVGQDSARLTNFAGGRFNLTGSAGKLADVSGAIDIFGVVTGIGGVFQGAKDGDARDVVEGLGNISGGLNSLAAATSSLAGTSRLGAAASRFSTLTAGTATLGKALGAAGGVISLGFGLYDVFTGDTGWEKASGGLAAAAGAVAIGSAFFGPPGWIVGGLISGALGIASIIVGDGGKSETAAIDDRMKAE